MTSTPPQKYGDQTLFIRLHKWEDHLTNSVDYPGQSLNAIRIEEFDLYGALTSPRDTQN